MPKRTRQRGVILLIFPMLLILWAIGWALIWAGDKPPTPVKTRRKETKRDSVHMIVNLPAEEQEITT